MLGRARHRPDVEGAPQARSTWWPATVLMLVALVDRIETGVVPGVLPLLQEEWGFSDTAGGAIPTAVTIAGLLVTLPAGYFADRTNRKNLIAAMVAFWSLIITGSALAPSFLLFFMSRVTLGVADSVDTPSALSLMGDFYEAKRRSRAYGLQRMCYLIGGGLGTLIGGNIAQLYGWRMAFFSMVIPGLVVAWLVWRLPEPERGLLDRVAAAQHREQRGHADDSPAPDSGPPAADPAPGPAAGSLRRNQLGADIRSLLKIRTIFFVYFGLMSLFLGIGGIFYWLPAFYTRTFGLDTGPAGTYTALVAIVGVVSGTFVGGLLGDRLHGRVPGIRVVIGGLSLLFGSLLMGGAFMIPSLGLQIGTLMLAVLVMATASPNLMAAIADVIPAPQRGIGFALVTFLMSVGSAFGPLGVGFASDLLDGSLREAFFVLVVPMLVGSVVVLIGRGSFEADAERALRQAGG